MTLQEARQRLIDQGYQGEPTAEALEAAGWDLPPANWPSPQSAIPREQVAQELLLLREEARSQANGARIVAIVERIAGVILPIL